MGGFSTEQLTANFYLWEQRGRGWQLWDEPVDLEPPFVPFFHSLPAVSAVDDGRRPTFLSSLADAFTDAFGRTEKKVEGHAIPESPTDLLPLAFDCEFPIKEIGIRIPPADVVTPEYAEQLLLNLGSCSWPLSFEIVGTGDSISVQLACREPDVVQVEEQLTAYFPHVVVKEGMALSSTLSERATGTIVIDCGLDQEFMCPLRTFGAFDPDPLVGVYGVLESLASGELGIVQVLFQAAGQPWSASIMRSVTDSRGESFFDDAPEMLPLAKEKVGRPFFAALVRVIAQSPSLIRTQAIAKALVGGFAIVARPQSNEIIPLRNDGYDDADHLGDVIERRTRRSGMLLNSKELVGLIHLPSSCVRVQKLRRETRKTNAAPPSVVGHPLVVGENIHRETSTLVTLSIEQRLRHVHVIGATGTGKSTLLLNMIVQDMEHGEGFAVLDPHGDLIDSILERIPENRYEDAVLFDPSDIEYPVGMNILEARSEVERNVLASDMVAIFRRFATSWGDQMTTVLGNAISALLEGEEKGTLADLKRFLIEKEYRSVVLQSVPDATLAQFWEREYPRLRGNPESAILTRIDSFLRPKLIRNVVDQKEGLDVASLVNGRKILLAKLAEGIIGEENAHLLGSLLVSKLHQVAVARQALAVPGREPFFLYIDEFQHFVTPSMASVLSGARKYRLGLVLAHQDLRQLWEHDKALANSVISNAGTRICFRLGDFDAEKLQDGFAHFDASDLQNLDMGEAIIRVERKDYDFNLRTFDAPSVGPGLAMKNRETVAALSRTKHGHPSSRIDSPLVVKREELVPSIYPAQSVEVRAKDERAATITSRDPDIHMAPLGIQQQKLSQHRYLQTLVKRMAEQRGYRAVIEEPTPDGKGRVDVGLEREGKKTAIEISVTTDAIQELHNIQKCIEAGYSTVIVCSTEPRALSTMRKLVSERLPAEDLRKVQLLQPEDLFLFLEEQTGTAANQEQQVRGYRVRVQYQEMPEIEKGRRRQVVIGVISQALRRTKRSY